MSHVAAVKLKINDITALRKACEELGLQFMENQRTFEWYGKWVQDYHAEDAAYKNGIKPEDYGKCVHAIRMGNYEPGDYEIGVIPHPSGKGMTVIYDFWGSGRKIMDQLGKGCEKLVQLYGVHAATRLAMSKGCAVKRTQLHDGKIQLQITNIK